MRRFWFGLLLLTVLLVGGIFLGLWVDSTFTALSKDMAKACDLAVQEQLLQADHIVSITYNRWLDCRKATAAIADHTPMEEIDQLFRELEVYMQAEEGIHYAATCAQLGALLQAMADSHSVSWWQLL